MMLKQLSILIAKIVNYLEHNAVRILMAVTTVIEIAIASFLGIVVLVLSMKTLGTVPSMISANTDINTLHEMLEYTFNLIICVEFIRMLIKHSMENVIEVLIFALARGLIVDHEEPLAVFVSIACIAILFLLRRFTLYEKDL